MEIGKYSRATGFTKILGLLLFINRCDARDGVFLFRWLLRSGFYLFLKTRGEVGRIKERGVYCRSRMREPFFSWYFSEVNIGSGSER